MVVYRDNGVQCYVYFAPIVSCDCRIECAFLAYIPNYELRTRDSRGVLPKKLSYKEAVAASSIANVAIAALLTGDMVKAGQAIESDLFHERYRQDLVREFATIKKVAKKNGAYATYLSGAGPTVMVLADPDKMPKIKAELEKQPFKGILSGSAKTMTVGPAPER